jgi:hypothetical protein
VCEKPRGGTTIHDRVRSYLGHGRIEGQRRDPGAFPCFGVVVVRLTGGGVDDGHPIELQLRLRTVGGPGFGGRRRPRVVGGQSVRRCCRRRGRWRRSVETGGRHGCERGGRQQHRGSQERDRGRCWHRRRRVHGLWPRTEPPPPPLHPRKQPSPPRRRGPRLLSNQRQPLRTKHGLARHHRLRPCLEHLLHLLLLLAVPKHAHKLRRLRTGVDQSRAHVLNHRDPCLHRQRHLQQRHQLRGGEEVRDFFLVQQRQPLVVVSTRVHPGQDSRPLRIPNGHSTSEPR